MCVSTHTDTHTQIQITLKHPPSLQALQIMRSTPQADNGNINLTNTSVSLSCMPTHYQDLMRWENVPKVQKDIPEATSRLITSAQKAYMFNKQKC